MGLDTSHNAWHGPYSAFTRFRTAVARAAGLKVEPIKYENGMTFDTADIPWEDIAARNPQYLEGIWREPPTDPLHVLIAHSDCDGVILPEHAGPLADRLEGLLPALEAAEAISDMPWSHAEKARQFIAGLRLAVAQNEPVDFH